MATGTCPAAATDPCWGGISDTAVTFNGLETQGANDYVLQLSTTPSFSNAREFTTITPNSSASKFGEVPCSGALQQCGPRFGPKFTIAAINLTALFPNNQSQPVYARIGARDNANGPDRTANPYIFSEAEAVPVALTPAVRR
jgi:hypothetical protein